MKEVSELRENGVYVLCAECAANTHLIENRRELLILLNMFKNRLSSYLKIFDYSITPTGWHLVVQLKSRAVIMNTYKTRQSLKEKRGKRICKSVDEVMSETLRLLRSHFTNKTNILRGRKGNASRGVFKKYVFTNIEDAQEYIEDVRECRVDVDQPVGQYRANSEHYDKDRQICRSSKLLSSKAYHQGGTMIYGLFGTCLKVFDYMGEWFRKCISNSCRIHGLEMDGW